jgi:polyisoprenoid-binding protein YceI
LVGVDLPNDAVGATQSIAGTLVVDANGAVVRDSSRITVNITGLKSDKDRRDNFIKRRTMETEKFPTVELIPTALRGLTARPADGATTTFELLADLTVHGVTKPTTWKVTAKSEGPDLVGSATTAFTFKDFSLDQPKVPVVLSVADTIKLEYDFRFTPAAKTP